ncbi:MAG: peptide deformylase [Alphaproteobacteria bacterium CG_4_9_14_3_um_filter_47_13]|nr:MAG: peptide deformylase [Alphaproteobacteria bacterium CG_4_9_14_3_um_filter_47_13]
MSKFTIYTVPHPVLKEIAKPVDRVDDTLRKQMDDMLETMYDAPGIGLAANQVGLLNRVLVMDLEWREEHDRKNPIFMANPEIIWESGETSCMEEGCLSIPEQFAEVIRPATVKVKYLDYHGKEAQLEAEGLLSHCVQHEIDHLNGLRFIDHLSSLKRNMMIRRVKKLTKGLEVL